MKRILVTAVAAALIASTVRVPYAEANKATDLGKKVAEKIVTSIAGEAGGTHFWGRTTAADG